MKHSIWYVIPFLLAALYFVDSFYEKNLSLRPVTSSSHESNHGSNHEMAPSSSLPLPAEATLLTK